ncbi:MAG: crossover junction endodeoxyribonuclease RuvC [Firmicutes bacterium]|nr:crossover junction endodeoxyribonuclease RuvC [Bacillota bacterium]
MIVLGIDPGTAIMGYSVLKKERGIQVGTYGVLRTPAKMAPHLRLAKLYSGLEELVQHYAPDCLAVESLFFNKNVKTALSVGEARGVALLVAAQHGLEVFEYTPLQVKQSVTGEGRATKEQVGYMVKALLKLKEVPQPDDACDALAVGICHINSAESLAGLARRGRIGH